jgi:hypothetical protein
MRFRGSIVLLTFAQMFGQDAAVAPKQLSPVGTPVTKPEAHRELNRTPLSLFNDLLSPDGAARARALDELLDTNLGNPSAVQEATLRAVNSGTDNEPEYILTLRFVVPLESIVLVMDCVNHRWRVAGQFTYSYVWNAENAEHFIEVHGPFILIRDFGGGTGVVSTMLRLYRFWNGALYRVVELSEHALFWQARGPGVATESTDATVLFREARFSPEAVLEVRTENRTTFRDARTPETKRSCKGYEWQAASFSFRPTARSTSAVCRAVSP